MKKALSIVLALMLILALFAGCGGSDTADETQAPATQAPATQAPATQAPETGDDIGDPVVLKVNNFGPEALPFGKVLTNAQIKVAELSDGNVTFENYHDGTLLGFNDSMQGVGQGIADIALVGPGAIDSVVTFNSVFTTMRKHLPDDSHNSSVSMRELIQEVPELQEEMASFNLRWVGCYALFGASIHCHGITPLTPDDMKGVSIEAFGQVTQYFAAMGANAVTLDPGDYYLDMERGVIQAQATHWPGTEGYKLTEVEDYHLLFGEGVASGIFTGMMGLVMNLEKFDTLTATQQQWIWDAFEYACTITDGLDLPAAEAAVQYCKDNGQTLVYLTTEEELAPWYEYIDSHNANWVEEVEAAGWPGQEALDKFDELLAQY